jgi:hypothetical protein
LAVVNPLHWLRDRPAALIGTLLVLTVAVWGFTLRALRTLPERPNVIDESSPDSLTIPSNLPASAVEQTLPPPSDLELRAERRRVGRQPVPETTTPPEREVDLIAVVSSPPPGVESDKGRSVDSPARGSSVVSERPHMYSSADADVEPPAVVAPNTLGRIPGTGTREDSAVIEVVINERGEVDAVKAIDVPRSLGDAVVMTSSLSAAKSWRFRPAMKDGHPVRYRQQLIVALR